MEKLSQKRIWFSCPKGKCRQPIIQNQQEPIILRLIGCHCKKQEPIILRLIGCHCEKQESIILRLIGCHCEKQEPIILRLIGCHCEKQEPIISHPKGKCLGINESQSLSPKRVNALALMRANQFFFVHRQQLGHETTPTTVSHPRI